MAFAKWVRGRLAEEEMRQVDLAEKLGMKQQSLSAKLKNGRFTLLEVIAIFRFFKADDQTILRIMR